LTIDQFRSHNYLPGAWAKELRTNHILQRVLQVMEDNHPARFAIAGDNNDDVSPTRAGIELGLTRGYSKYGDTLRLLAEPKRKIGDIGETTYDKPPKPEELTQHGI
jgi:hypothetical protein